MRFFRKTRCLLLPLCALAALAARPGSAEAQVQEVVVGVTMTCPYENAIEGSCWSGAHVALTKLDEVKKVDDSANGYNCTARVYLKNAGLPDPDKWASQFKKMVDQTYIFRGVEVTAGGTIKGDGSALVLRIDGIERSVTLRTLEHKLQWNAKKGAARQPEPDERSAYEELAAKIKDVKGGELKANVTGPLRNSDSGYILEVREYFPLASVAGE